MRLTFYIFLFSLLSSCYYHDFTTSRSSSRYYPTKYTYQFDSIDSATNNSKWSNYYNLWDYRKLWKYDSLTVTSFYLDKNGIRIPIIPLIYAIQFDRINSYSFWITIHDAKNEIMKIDSISYSFYDSLNTVFYNNISEITRPTSFSKNRRHQFYIPKSFKMNNRLKPKELDLYGDIVIYFTRQDGRLANWNISNVKYEYSNSVEFTTDMPW